MGKKKAKSSRNVYCDSESPVRLAQTVLRKRLTQLCLPPEIHGFSKERRQLFNLIKRTSSGESNSVLVIGPRGSGKTMLLKSVLTELEEDESFQQNLLQVHLNGLLQTDDRIALKEITRQLQLENTIGDRVFGSFSETLQFLLDALKSGDSQNTKPVLFILEEFDLFAHHRNQTLLYNLFDISQSAQTPICVIGVTCRLDIMKEATVKDVLRRQFNLNKDVRGLIALLAYPICQLSSSQPTLNAGDFLDSFKMVTADTKSSMLHGVSVLELCLIIAMKHLTDIYDGEPFNFEMVYSEYLKFAQRKSSMQVFEKPVVLKAFEHLMALELIKSIDSSVTRVQKEYRLMTLLIHPTQILDALQKYPSCPTEVKHWASSAV